MHRLLNITTCSALIARGNFQYDTDTGAINHIDFGAAREYTPGFVSDYLRMVAACAARDREGIVRSSTAMGFLTGGWGEGLGPRMPARWPRHSRPPVGLAVIAGDESAVMLDAHVEAGIMVGVPFGHPGHYEFGSHGGMTKRVSELGAVMLKQRLSPVRHP